MLRENPGEESAEREAPKPDAADAARDSGPGEAEAPGTDETSAASAIARAVIVT
jgi:hypothetical protein